MMGKKREEASENMHFVAITLPPRAELSASAAALLASYARRRCGRAPWRAVAAEEHPGPAGTLLLLRPAPVYSVRIADWAEPFLRKYF